MTSWPAQKPTVVLGVGADLQKAQPCCRMGLAGAGVWGGIYGEQKAEGLDPTECPQERSLALSVPPGPTVSFRPSSALSRSPGAISCPPASCEVHPQ